MWYISYLLQMNETRRRFFFGPLLNGPRLFAEEADRFTAILKEYGEDPETHYIRKENMATVCQTRSKYTPNPTTLLEYLNNVLYEHPELSMDQIAKRIGIASNTLSCWRRGQSIPIWRAMQIAEMVGDDVLRVRDIGIREHHPELFQGKYDNLVTTLSPDEQECLRILRGVPLDNPKVRSALQAVLAAFVQACESRKNPVTPASP